MIENSAQCGIVIFHFALHSFLHNYFVALWCFHFSWKNQAAVKVVLNQSGENVKATSEMFFLCVFSFINQICGKVRTGQIHLLEPRHWLDHPHHLQHLWQWPTTIKTTTTTSTTTKTSIFGEIKQGLDTPQRYRPHWLEEVAFASITLLSF